MWSFSTKIGTKLNLSVQFHICLCACVHLVSTYMPAKAEISSYIGKSYYYYYYEFRMFSELTIDHCCERLFPCQETLQTYECVYLVLRSKENLKSIHTIDINKHSLIT